MRTYIKFTTSRLFTPAAYLKFIKNPSNKRAIESVKIIPPVLGSSDFGKIYVEFKYLPTSLLPKINK
jgi:hypothetical protein